MVLEQQALPTWREQFYASYSFTRFLLSTHITVSLQMRKLSYEELLEERLTAEEARTAQRFPIHVVVDNVRSLYNVGSLFRTADAANIACLWLCGFTPKPPRKEISKTALGADASVPWEYRESTVEALIELRASGVSCIAVEITDNAVEVRQLQKETFPIALVVGNEVHGVSEEALDVCDASVALPMYGVKHSLNVAVAAGITMYEAVSRWTNLQE